jgi:hypothetical protein
VKTNNEREGEAFFVNFFHSSIAATAFIHETDTRPV